MLSSISSIKSPNFSSIELHQLVYDRSGCKNLDFSSFQHELGLHIAKKESLIDFDEDFYLNANRDVAEAVAKGIYSCAHTHYCLAGQYEGRAWRRKSQDVLGQSALEFEIPTDPQVSIIIIPVYDGYLLTHQCLKSVLNHTANVSYEVVIVDDASRDQTQQVLSRIHA